MNLRCVKFDTCIIRKYEASESYIKLMCDSKDLNYIHCLEFQGIDNPSKREKKWNIES